MTAVEFVRRVVYVQDGKWIGGEQIIENQPKDWNSLVFLIYDHIIMLRNSPHFYLSNHPDADILIFDMNFKLTYFFPKEINKYANLLEQVRKTSSSPADSDFWEFEHKLFNFAKSNSVDWLPLFRPNHNIGELL